MKSSKILAIAFAAFFSATLVSCSNSKKSEQNQEVVEISIMQVDDLLAKADSLVGQEVTFEGVCTHTCKHGGKKAFIMGTDDTKTIRVDANGEIGSFPSDVVNNIVEIQGTLVEERIDEAVIQRMEQQYQDANAVAHGKNKEVGCSSEKKAHGQKDINTFEKRMQDYRDKIAVRKEKEGKEYLSFYAVKGISYKVK